VSVLVKKLESAREKQTVKNEIIKIKQPSGLPNLSI